MLKQDHSRATLALAIFGALAVGQAHAITFNVTNNNDSGPSSLRQALIGGNSASETNIIELSAITGQTINLTGSLLIAQVPEGQGGCGSLYDVDQRDEPRPSGDGSCDARSRPPHRLPLESFCYNDSPHSSPNPVQKPNRT